VTVKTKLLAVVFTLIYIWWLTPIPEGTILFALLTGGTVSLATGDWQTSLLTFVVTYQPVNWFVETYLIPKLHFPTIRKSACANGTAK
jgi:hypothetical protein